MPTKFGVVALFPGRPIVDQYVALDVSLQKTAVCVLNASGRVEIDGQIRGILKTFGMVVGSGNKGAFAQRARMLVQDHPVLSALVDKLIEVRAVAVAKVAALDKEIRRFVRDDPTLRRFMTVPGVGPVTALAFRSTIDEPDRFKRARDVGPYLGLTPRRYQSGETDRQGRISKCGD